MFGLQSLRLTYFCQLLKHFKTNKRKKKLFSILFNIFYVSKTYNFIERINWNIFRCIQVSMFNLFMSFKGKNVNLKKLQKCVYIDVQQPPLLSTTRAQLFSLVATNLNCLPKAPLKNKLPKHDLHHQIQLIYIRNKNLQEMIELRH